MENADVRFVYQPFEELYVLLITNKGSNILQDISTLSLIVRLISSLTPSMSEPAIIANSFELLCAFDEVVSLGYKENVSLQQVRNVLEGESHEEKIQEIIERNKEAEAKEELKRRAKQLEMQRREQQKAAQAGARSAGGYGGGMGGYGGGSGSGSGPGGQNGLGAGGMAGGYASVPRFDTAPAAERDPYRSSSPAASSTTSKPVFKGSGMKLGGKKGKQTDLLDALGNEAVIPPEDLIQEPHPDMGSSQTFSPLASRPASSNAHTTPGQAHAAAASTSAADYLPQVDPESVHVTIREHVSATILRDGGLQSLELKGDLDLKISDPAYTKLKLALSPPSGPAADLGRDLQFQQHPNVAKFTSSNVDDRIIALKDPKRSFPVKQGLGVLRWRLSTKDEGMLPLSSEYHCKL